MKSLIIMRRNINPRFFTVKIQERSCLGTTVELYSDIIKKFKVYNINQKLSSLLREFSKKIMNIFFDLLNLQISQTVSDLFSIAKMLQMVAQNRYVQNGQLLVAQIPWTHNVNNIITKEYTIQSSKQKALQLVNMYLLKR